MVSVYFDIIFNTDIFAVAFGSESPLLKTRIKRESGAKPEQYPLLYVLEVTVSQPLSNREGAVSGRARRPAACIMTLNLREYGKWYR